MEPVLGKDKVEKVIGAVRQIESLGGVRELTALLVP
jgi:hypothetical protein